MFKFHRKIARILVCRTDAIGDAILTLPVCTSLKNFFPQADIGFMVSDYTAELFKGQSHFDELLVYDQKAGSEVLINRLKSKDYDLALMVYPDRYLSWLVFRAGIPMRLGTGRRWWSFLYNYKLWHSRKKVLKHEADYNLDFVRAMINMPVLAAPRLAVFSDEQKEVAELFETMGINRQASLIIVHPGGRGSSANWNQAAYTECVMYLLSQTEYQVLLTGAGQEITVLQAIKAECEKQQLARLPYVLDKPIALSIMKALIHQAQGFISGNTGPMHIAAAVGTPLAAIFPTAGVTGPERWRPLTQKAVIFTPKHFPVSADTQGITQEQINPKEVVEELLSLIASA